MFFDITAYTCKKVSGTNNSAPDEITICKFWGTFPSLLFWDVISRSNVVPCNF
jgi:hypothetical protein